MITLTSLRNFPIFQCWDISSTYKMCFWRRKIFSKGFRTSSFCKQRRI